ncbi:hypothetical protein I3843_09G052000 [Carya illinoinensis]|uniref:C2H2-type domain-containing protein n=1 Tax=Carya illinoinensis TaxID=32201 RepID=A0A8T1PIX6_CARIL|nr:hypothetical protein CIPAW_09G051500 [Carya illinoinensis]KAG6694512.1 hypothetical protein I3842_09G051600 [Carya illinoinensis]KAG7962167.1 hypothetical protein I3843_09G052000 [Carya illinoinensis]
MMSGCQQQIFSATLATPENIQGVTPDQTPCTKPEYNCDLKLPNIVRADHGPNPAPNLLYCLNAAQSLGSSSEAARVNEPAMERIFSCKYCNKKFSNPQALGGHQNTHKHERAVTKKNNVIYVPLLPAFEQYSNHHPLSNHPYLAMAAATVPLHGSMISETGLGIQPYSTMIHKPYHRISNSTWPHGWKRLTNIMGSEAAIMDDRSLYYLQASTQSLHHHDLARSGEFRQLDMTVFNTSSSNAAFNGRVVPRGPHTVFLTTSLPFYDRSDSSSYHEYCSSSNSHNPQRETTPDQAEAEVLDLSLKL